MMSRRDEFARAAIDSVVLAAHLLRQWDLQGLLEQIAHADSVGPILDPTLWMRKEKAMREDRALVEAAMPLWRFAKERLEKTAPAAGDGR